MNEERFEQIERYVCGEMASDERLKFEQEIAADHDLERDVKIVTAIRDAVQEHQAHDKNDAAIRRTLDKLNADFFLTGETEEDADLPVITPVRKIRRWKILIAAAAIVGIVLLSVVWLMTDNKDQEHLAGSKKADTIDSAQPDKNRQPGEKAMTEEATPGENATPDTEVLYAQYFKRDAVPGEKVDELALGFKLYAAGNMIGARDVFETAKQSDLSRGDETEIKLQNFYIDYYTAQCFMAEGKMDEAISNLKTALNKSPNDSLMAKTQWYLALAYMKKSDKKSAVDLLRKLNSNATLKQYKTDVENLLKELEK